MSGYLIVPDLSEEEFNPGRIDRKYWIVRNRTKLHFLAGTIQLILLGVNIYTINQYGDRLPSDKLSMTFLPGGNWSGRLSNVTSLDDIQGYTLYTFSGLNYYAIAAVYCGYAALYHLYESRIKNEDWIQWSQKPLVFGATRRWVMFAVTATAMHFQILYIGRISEVFSYVSVVGMTGIINLGGNILETLQLNSQFSPRKNQASKQYLAATGGAFTPGKIWWPLMVLFGSQHILLWICAFWSLSVIAKAPPDIPDGYPGYNIPDFVYTIYIAMFILFMSFIIPLWYDFMFTIKTKTTSETRALILDARYTLISIISKATLTFIVLGGVRSLGETSQDR